MRADPLLIDLYEMTMAAGYLHHGMERSHAVFDLYFRNNPFGGGYAVFAGLEPALAHLRSLRFETEDRIYLEGLGLFDRRFLDYLREFRFGGNVTAVAEGEVVFAGEPLVTVEGALGEVQMVETALLNIISFQTLVATKAARVVNEADSGTEASIAEFGARRAQGPDGALSAARAAFVGGASGTSLLAAGRAFGIPVTGTQAHSWVMAFPTELEAFRAYAEAFPDACVLLVDTYDTLGSGLPNAITVAGELRARGHVLKGIRIDSGDLAYLGKESRRLLDQAGFPEVRIVASNELDEHVIESVRKEGGRVDIYGVGTRLVTAAGEGGGALGAVYKLVELDGRPRIKVSSDRAKSTIPGRKRLWRVGGGEAAGGFEMDVLSRFDESPGPGETVRDPGHPMRRTRIPDRARMEDIRSVVMHGGERAGEAPSLTAIAARAKERLERLPEGCRRLLNPHVYRVALSEGLDRMRSRMIEEVSGESEER